MTDNEKLINIEVRAEHILRREIMEANCKNFEDLVDKMAQQIINICKL